MLRNLHSRYAVCGIIGIVCVYMLDSIDLML
jgi:hypothetical protein